MASFETLMRQAPMTAGEYLEKAIKEIDEQLGEGYAKKNPVLMGAFIKASAIDYHAGILSNLVDAVESNYSTITAMDEDEDS